MKPLLFARITAMLLMLLILNMSISGAQPIITSFTPKTGCAGTTVTINGTAFTGTTDVAFGGIPATSFVVVNGKTITAVVGDGASGAVTVTKSSGTATLDGFTHFTPTWYPDADLDGYGNADAPLALCFKPAGYMTDTTDCDDTNPAIHPEGYEIVNGVDDNCNGLLDDAPPFITSFSPAAGDIGSSVNITGINFSTDPAENIVYFGATRAVVTAASATSLTVTVPVGATYHPISIINQYGLTGWSEQPFLVTIGTGCAVEPGLYQEAQTISSANHLPAYVADMDADGKPDLTSISNNEYYDYYITVDRNTSSPDSISLSSFFTYIPEYWVWNYSINDFDGDGKPDFYESYLGSWASYVKVFRNTSTPGSISFQQEQDLPVGAEQVNALSVGDMNADGKADLLIATSVEAYLTIFKNTSVPGSISFSEAGDIDYGGNWNHWITTAGLADFDGDRMPDVVMTGNFDSNGEDFQGISLIRNKGVPGSFAFDPRYDLYSIPENIFGYYLLTGDLDGDGKTDLIAGGDSILIFRNNSTVGNLNFVQPIALGSIGFYTINDINGDGKPDLVSSLNGELAVLENISSPGSILFTLKTGLAPLSWFTIIDLNIDGKTDLLSSVDNDHFNYLRNQCTPITCHLPDSFNSSVTANSATLYWNGVDNATLYKLRYKVSGTDAWTTLTKIHSAPVTVSALLPHTKYFWQVKTICDAHQNIVSDWSVKQSFRTASAKLSTEAITTLEVFPNPFTTTATVAFAVANDYRVTIELFDVLGKPVFTLMDENLTAGHYNRLLSNARLREGIYFIKLRTVDINETQQVLMKKIVVESDR